MRELLTEPIPTRLVALIDAILPVSYLYSFEEYIAGDPTATTEEYNALMTCHNALQDTLGRDRLYALIDTRIG